MFSGDLVINDIFQGINMVTLLNALFLTIACAVPLSFTYDDIDGMNKRVYAGADVWQTVFAEEGVLDIKSLNVSKPSSAMNMTISLSNLEACWGCREGLMFTNVRDNFEMLAPPSILMAHNVAVTLGILTLSILLGLLVILSGSSVRSVEPVYQVEGEDNIRHLDSAGHALRGHTLARESFAEMGLNAQNPIDEDADPNSSSTLTERGQVKESATRWRVKTNIKVKDEEAKAALALMGTDPVGRWMDVAKLVYFMMYVMSISGIVMVYSLLFDIMNTMYPHPLAEAICSNQGWVPDPTDPTRFINGSFVGCKDHIWRTSWTARLKSTTVPEIWNGDYYTHSITYIVWYMSLAATSVLIVVGYANFAADSIGSGKLERAHDSAKNFHKIIHPVLQTTGTTFEELKCFANDPIYLDNYLDNAGVKHPLERLRAIKAIREIAE